MLSGFRICRCVRQKTSSNMSSEDEEEHFVGDEHGLHEGGEVVADLVGDDMQQSDEDASEDEEGVPENADQDPDDSIHTFEGHKGQCQSSVLPAFYLLY